MTGWIEVSKRLPPTRKRVLVAYMTHHGKPAVTMGWYCPANTVSSGNFDGEVDDEYNEEDDEYYLKEQWVDESVESEFHYPIYGVTKWMPIPSINSSSLPEEENQAMRNFLMFYGDNSGVTVEGMRENMRLSGNPGCWPEWVNVESGHLTKSGAQDWIKYLLLYTNNTEESES